MYSEWSRRVGCSRIHSCFRASECCTARFHPWLIAAYSERCTSVSPCHVSGPTADNQRFGFSCCGPNAQYTIVNVRACNLPPPHCRCHRCKQKQTVAIFAEGGGPQRSPSAARAKPEIQAPLRKPNYRTPLQRTIQQRELTRAMQKDQCLEPVWR